ncbi:hypothetical protein JN06_01391 [Bacteroides zoogleoformans]|uniref:Tetratricopeptide repeat protein n=2 Tax=Bacteroides zoogleoformans TaxID=28119 RepID=A0ABM6T9K5_9BACE|nr:hypothetical protein C4H11_10785 [Bacteroides zoogleoformans]TWJ14458.1 hypothetical protein JN06_01391 [Bacteroides zoogleoformans]
MLTAFIVMIVASIVIGVIFAVLGVEPPQKGLSKQMKSTRIPYYNDSGVDYKVDNNKYVLLSAKELEKYKYLLSPELFADMLLAKDGEKVRVLKSEIDRMEKELKNDVSFGQSFQSSLDGRNKATALEKSGDLYAAISAYEECVQEGKSNSSLTIYNYAHDVDRLAILYRKTKQKDKEITLLTDMIKLNPKFNGIDKWKERLNRLINKK